MAKSGRSQSAKQSATKASRRDLDDEMQKVAENATRKILKLFLEDEFPKLKLNRQQIDMVVDFSTSAILESSLAVLCAHCAAMEREKNDSNNGPNEDDDDGVDDSDDDDEDVGEELGDFVDDVVEERRQRRGTRGRVLDNSYSSGKGGGWVEVGTVPMDVALSGPGESDEISEFEV